MPVSCFPDPDFGQSGSLWSEIPTPLYTPNGRVEENPTFVGGYADALWQPGRSAVLVTA